MVVAVVEVGCGGGGFMMVVAGCHCLGDSGGSGVAVECRGWCGWWWHWLSLLGVVVVVASLKQISINTDGGVVAIICSGWSRSSGGQH